MSSVFFTWPSANARLAATVVLPSSGIEEVTSTIFFGESIEDSITPLRMVRIASENEVCGSSRNTRSSCRPFFTFVMLSMPSVGTPRRVSTSWLVLMVLSRRSSSSASEHDASSDASSARPTIRRLFGPKGPAGTIAGSTTRAIGVWISPVMLVSL